jgi:hypothetical protein
MIAKEVIIMEENPTTQPEGEKKFTREQLATAVDNLKKELEISRRKPTKIEEYGIKHALHHYDMAHPDEVPQTTE